MCAKKAIETNVSEFHANKAQRSVSNVAKHEIMEKMNYQIIQITIEQIYQ